MTEFYLYLNSAESIDIRKNNADFLFQFSKDYILEGSWLCALVESSLTCDFTPQSKRLYLNCDIIEETFVRNKLQPVLTNIEIETRYKKCKFTECLHRRYRPVSVKKFNTIRLSLKGEDLKPIDLNSNDFHCVLHFKKSWVP